MKVAIRAMALNHLDLWIRRGMPHIRPALPLVMGCDAAGEVTDIGEGVTDFSAGDRVMLTPMTFLPALRGLPRRRAQPVCRVSNARRTQRRLSFAEQVVVDEWQARKIGPDVSFEDAAAFSLTFLTAWRMLMTKAGLRPGETVLIHGIGGGVSYALLAIAKLVGAAAIATTGEAWKREKALALGADAALDYTSDKLVKEIFAATDGRGVDVVADSVGGPTWSVSVKVVRSGGRIVTCGATAGAQPGAELTRIFWKQIHVMGSTMGTLGEFTEITRLLNGGRLRPLVDRVFPAADIHKAHEHLEHAGQFGKIVLVF
ncbi:MAG: zinc-binding dehydrogenase [Deltaproteobacteria bacterium]|nr:zinc-binding dehydrogenase [Deltaproteobacteria bacterium]